MSNAINLVGKVIYLVVTGASKGIGATLAIETAKKISFKSTLVLLARSIDGLEATKREILKYNSDLTVFVESIDLTKPSIEDLKAVINETYNHSNAFDMMMVIHNVGSIGDVSKWAREIDDYSELESYFSCNVFGPIVLNTQLLKIIPSSIKKFIVNITSKAGIVPFKSFGFYCPGKAAREMYFRVLAEEEPDILVLNYSPGPVETDMTVDAQVNARSEETSGMFKDLREQGTILTTHQTVTKLLNIVSIGNYESGAHIDFYD